MAGPVLKLCMAAQFHADVQRSTRCDDIIQPGHLSSVRNQLAQGLEYIKICNYCYQFIILTKEL